MYVDQFQIFRKLTVSIKIYEYIDFHSYKVIKMSLTINKTPRFKPIKLFYKHDVILLDIFMNIIVI